MSSTTTQNADAINVMLVDDSAVVRGLISRILESEPDIKIVASVSNGEQGVVAAARHTPDIAILDIEMPVMDGITALPKILAASPGTRVLMCSTLTVHNAEATLRALRLGATDCIAKPSNSSELNSAADFKSELLRLVRSLGRVTAHVATARPATASAGTYAGGHNAPLKQKTPFELRRNPASELFKPNLVAIGSSTGGPQALFKVIENFKGFDVPVIVTQHMPATFTKMLAQHITQQTGVPAFEGETGMAVERGKVYIAPGGFHMTFVKKGGSIEIVADSGPPENYCRPSVDPMVRSAIAAWGPKILAVILTGMGHDGIESCKSLVDAGGRVIAQDQETSVVWGMPGAVAIAGICSAVLPLQDIGPFVRQLAGKA